MTMMDPKSVCYFLICTGIVVLIRHGEVTADDKGNEHHLPDDLSLAMNIHSSYRIARLQNGVREVRTILGSSVNVSEKDIEDSLWHYYYDVHKTVNYLLRKLQRRSTALN